ncbi:MAG: efflux RND transporter periplasmic adaptor subunit [Ignavibacteriales bacterium]|nr:efflux RND transporter periplasmic adaptor subunit [Ignavibacteriales bacterium]
MKRAKIILTLILTSILASCGNNDDGKSIKATGNIEATFVTLSSKVAGEVLEINFPEGSLVNAGDTILRIDDETLKLQLMQASAARQSAEAQLELLKIGSRREDIAQAQSMFTQAEIGLAQAEKDKERMQNLLATNAITKKQFEDVNSKYEVVKSQFNAAKENLTKIKNIARPEDLRKAEAGLNQTIANEKLIQKSINDCYVKSPINGFVVEHFYEKGETVSPMASLIKVADLSKVDLDIYINEVELPKVQLNQEVNVTVDAFDDKIFNGKVIYISPESEFTPKNIQTPDERTKLVYKVKVEIDNPDFQLKSGMPADAEIKLQD